jgi:hypothetical protein
MIMTLISFLGGSAFRMIFGSVMDWFNKKQDHNQEIALLTAQSKLDAERHTRDLERIRLQSELGVKEITIKGDVEEQKVMADAFLEAVKATKVQTGVWWADAWNAVIRPSGATVSLIAWVVAMAVAGFVLGERDWALISAFLGVFVGDRIYTRGKL